MFIMAEKGVGNMRRRIHVSYEEEDVHHG